MDSKGLAELKIDGKRILCVHGDINDNYWSSLNLISDPSPYEGYDYVLSGHSHIPHYFEQYYKVDDPKMRNKRKCIFVNPGSVGQPRNRNNRAQYCILDFGTEEIQFRKVDYDIDFEQEAFDDSVDSFYKKRLRYGT
jgi:predicted phosphodiesterase